MPGWGMCCRCQTDALGSGTVSQTSIPRAYFEKDNDARTGSQGDDVFRDTDEVGIEIVSIMFDMTWPPGAFSVGRPHHPALCHPPFGVRLQPCQHRFSVFAGGQLIDANLVPTVVGHHHGRISRGLKAQAQRDRFGHAGPHTRDRTPATALQQNATALFHLGLTHELGQLIGCGLASGLLWLTGENNPECTRFVQNDLGFGVAYNRDAAVKYTHRIVT